MKTLRLCLLVAAGCAAALVVRDDRRADGAAPHSLRATLRGVGAAEPLTARGVCDALVSAGRAGLSLGLELLGDAEATAREGAAQYLGRQRSRLAVPHLIRLLRDPEPAVRRSAALALGAIGDPQALPFLDRAVGESEPVVAEAALRAARDIRTPATASKNRGLPRGAQ